MRFVDAKQSLPCFARGLLEQVIAEDESSKLAQLRAAVKEELKDYRAGMNPLEPKQAEQLYQWLMRSAI